MYLRFYLRNIIGIYALDATELYPYIILKIFVTTHKFSLFCLPLCQATNIYTTIAIYLFEALVFMNKVM